MWKGWLLERVRLGMVGSQSVSYLPYGIRTTTINVKSKKDYDSIEDGVNVRKTYKFIKDITDIKSNLSVQS